MAKYDSLRKLKRNRALYEMKENDPDISFKELGEFFNLTPQRAWELYGLEKKKVEKEREKLEPVST